MRHKTKSLDKIIPLRTDVECYEAYHKMTFREKIVINEKRRKALKRILKIKS